MSSVSLPPLAIMSSEKTKTASQTDGKAAQSKKSEMGMMSYKVGTTSEDQHKQWSTLWSTTIHCHMNRASAADDHLDKRGM